MQHLKIGQLAHQAGVNVETVRYYERRGLLPRPGVTAAGYRQYTARDLQRLEFIKRSQSLGFSLSEITELLNLRVDPGATCADVKQRIEAKTKDIEQKIATLEQMRAALSQLAASCGGTGPSSECPILDALEQQESP